MSAIIDLALQKLLRNAERAWAAGAKPRDLLFTPAGLPVYRSITSRAQLDEVHAELEAARRAGAITIEWDKRAGDRGQVERIAIADPDRLAEHLQVVPLWQACAQARVALQPWIRRPQVSALLHTWESGKMLRNRGPLHLPAFKDALRVLDRLAEQPEPVDRSIRRFSAMLFADSKRIDDLAMELDLLTRIDEGPPRSDIEVFSELGLVVHPQPFLIAGPATIITFDGETLRVPRPYLGLPPAIIADLYAQPRYVLSIENMDTFHQLSLGAAGEIDGLLLYTAGMPSPAWAAAYRRIVAATPADVPVLHWGDTDVGGLRILCKLEDLLSGTGRHLQPWQMGAAEAGIHHQTLGESEARYAAGLATRRGWTTLAAYFETNRRTIEQQVQALRLPEVRLERQRQD